MTEREKEKEDKAKNARVGKEPGRRDGEKRERERQRSEAEEVFTLKLDTVEDLGAPPAIAPNEPLRPPLRTCSIVSARERQTRH